MALAEQAYTGNGTTTRYNIPFDYILEDHIKVSLNEAAFTGFTVDTTVNPRQVVFTAISNATATQETTGAPKTDVAIVVFRDTPINSPLVDYTDGSTLIADDLDTSNKQWLYLLQEQDDEQSATIQPVTAGLDAQSKKIINVADPTAAQHAATKNYVDTQDALHLRRDGSNAMAAALAMGSNKITGLATPTDNTDASTKAYVDGLITTNSGNVTAAQNAQAAAESARDSALAAFDNFDDRYLGEKNADPTADNDGDALAGGMLYFDSAGGTMKVYTGSAWVAAFVSGTANNIAYTAGGNIVATNVQAAIQEVDTEKFANNVSATDRLLGRSSAGAGAVEEITCTSAGRNLLDDADAAAQRTTLGLGDAALTSAAQTFTQPQRGNITSVSIAASDTTKQLNFETGTNNFALTLGNTNSCQLTNPSNLSNCVGQSGSIFVIQDGTGSRLLSYGNAWHFPGGTAAAPPTLSTGANACDRIDYIVRSSTSIHCVFTAAYSA